MVKRKNGDSTEEIDNELKNKSEGRKIGYARVSTDGQNLDRQLVQLQTEGCDIIYKEKISGTKVDRPELIRMLDDLRSGDTVIVCELTRVSRSTSGLLDLVNEISQKGASIKSLKESWLDTTTAHGKLLLTIFAGLSQFERDLIAERTKEGMAIAKSKGKEVGRPKRSQTKIEHAIELYKSGNYTGSEISEITGISRSTLYRRLREEGLV